MLLALEQSDRELVTGLHGWLFDDVSFHAELDDEQLDRYRSANDYASRYCHRLQQQLIDSNENAIAELRQFYRLQLTDKISHIHSKAWS